MKRVRTEQIQYVVAQYLKRRQYVDAESPMRGAKLFQTPEEMAANLTGKETALLGSLFRVLFGEL
jgi:DNA-binding NarL/FixJ family response regulator